MTVKRKIPHFTIDEDNHLIIVHSAKNLTDEEQAQIKMMKELLGFSITFSQAFTDAQKKVHEKARTQNKDYFLGNSKEGIEPAITAKADQDLFKAIYKRSSKNGGGFFKAKAWWNNRDMLAKECGAESYDKATPAQKKDTVELVSTVKIKGGKIIR